MGSVCNRRCDPGGGHWDCGDPGLSYNWSVRRPPPGPAWGGRLASGRAPGLAGRLERRDDLRMKLTAARSGSTVTPGSSERAAHRASWTGSRETIFSSAYRLMLLSRKLDDKEIQLKNQSQIFFQISGAGHEAVLVAAGRALRPRSGLDLSVLPRPRGLPHARRHALRHAAAGRRRQGRPGVGRPADAVALGTSRAQHRLAVEPDRHAVPAGGRRAEATLLYERAGTTIPGRLDHVHDGEVTYVSLGDGTTSEGEFWESLNTACTKRLPLVILVEDNGYAISVPVDVQTPGGSISRLVRGFPSLHVAEVDGTDYLASARVMREAVDVRARPPRPGARARTRRPALLALALRRRAALQAGGAARARGRARSDPPALGPARRARASRPRTTWPASTPSSTARSTRRPIARSRAEKPHPGDRDALRLLSERRSSLLGLRSSGRCPRGDPTRWSPPSTAR